MERKYVSRRFKYKTPRAGLGAKQASNKFEGEIFFRGLFLTSGLLIDN